MREIKFRAWNKKKKVMCYANEDNTAGYWDGVRLSTIEFINYELSTNPYNEGLDSFSFRTNYEIMQYTGLKDKNGKEIYEGDVVKVELIDITDIYEVYYEESKARFSFRDSCGFNWGFDRTVKKEVIGNIYESEDNQ